MLISAGISPLLISGAKGCPRPTSSCIHSQCSFDTSVTHLMSLLVSSLMPLITTDPCIPLPLPPCPLQPPFILSYRTSFLTCSLQYYDVRMLRTLYVCTYGRTFARTYVYGAVSRAVRTAHTRCPGVCTALYNALRNPSHEPCFSLCSLSLSLPLRKGEATWTSTTSRAFSRIPFRSSFSVSLMPIVEERSKKWERRQERNGSRMLSRSRNEQEREELRRIENVLSSCQKVRMKNCILCTRISLFCGKKKASQREREKRRPRDLIPPANRIPAGERKPWKAPDGHSEPDPKGNLSNGRLPFSFPKKPKGSGRWVLFAFRAS